MKQKSSKSSLNHQSGSYETSSIGRLHSKELSGKQVIVNREDAKLHWVHLLDFSPLHYWLRGSIGFEKVQKVGQSRHLFLIH